MGNQYRSVMGEKPTGNAAVGDVLFGKTFSNADGTDKVGTMPNNGAVSASLDTTTTSYTVPVGYHNGNGSVEITTQAKSTTASRSDQTITPDAGKVLSSVSVAKYPDASGTYTASTRGNALDMGATNNLRYVDTTGVPNSNSGTYSFPANDTGGTKDLGETNSYRYVNAQNVYNKGKADGISNAKYVKDTIAANSSKSVTLNGNFTKIVVVTSYTLNNDRTQSYAINGTNIHLDSCGFVFSNMSLYVGEVNGNYVNPTITSNNPTTYIAPFMVFAY